MFTNVFQQVQHSLVLVLYAILLRDAAPGRESLGSISYVQSVRGNITDGRPVLRLVLTPMYRIE